MEQNKKKEKIILEEKIILVQNKNLEKLELEEFKKAFRLGYFGYSYSLYPSYQYDDLAGCKSYLVEILDIRVDTFKEYVADYFKIDIKKCKNFDFFYRNYGNIYDFMTINVDDLFKIKPTKRQIYEIAYNIYKDEQFNYSHHHVGEIEVINHMGEIEIIN